MRIRRLFPRTVARPLALLSAPLLATGLLAPGTANASQFVEPDPAKAYKLYNPYAPGTVVDVAGGSTQDGAQLIAWAYHGTRNQMWKFRPRTHNGQRYYEIVSLASGKCMDVAWAGQDNGAAVIQWPCNGRPNQLWRIRPVDTDTSFVHFRLQAAHSRKCLDGANPSLTPPPAGAQFQQWDCHDKANQAWSWKAVPAR